MAESKGQCGFAKASCATQCGGDCRCLITAPLELKREESDSIHPVLFSFFSSTVWSPETVKAIIVALEVMPKRKWERAIVDKQCLLVYEQMQELPAHEACRRLILSLEYMKTTQVFWRGRFEQGKPIVLSLGSNHDGSHHHCLEMYEELTRRGWTSALEGAWMMEEMRQNAERGACMHMAVKVLAGLGLPSDHLDFDELVEIGRPHYTRQNSQRSSETKEQESGSGISGTAVEPIATGEDIPFQANPVLMGQKEAQSLLDHISHMLPGIRDYLFCESTKFGGASVCLAPPSDQSGGGVCLTTPADWERLSQVLDETGWNWNATMIQLFGDQVSSPPDEQAKKYVEEVSLDGSAAGMDRGEAMDLAEQIAQEIPTLAPYLFWGPIKVLGLATLELSPPCNSGVGVCLTGPLGWERLRDALLKAQGDWDTAVALLFGRRAFSGDKRSGGYRPRVDTVRGSDRPTLDEPPNEQA